MIFKRLIILIIFFQFIQLFGVEGRPKMRRACLNRIDSIIDLQWYKPTDNCGSFTSFSIYGRYNSLSLYDLLFTSSNFNTSSANIKLKNLLNWEFYLVYNKSCNGIDSIFSDTLFIDNTTPLDQELDSVSVDLSTQKTIIGWKKSLSSDTKGYYIYHITGTNSIIYDTSSTSLLDKGNRNPGSGPVNYGIAAYDSCLNASLISPGHKTMYLNGQITDCPTQQITLSWTPYVGWQVFEYQIFLKINSGNYTKIGSVISNINSFVYNYTSFGSTYCFYIRAIDISKSKSSSSNISCYTSNGLFPTKNSYVAKASVKNKEIELVLVTETGKSLKQINLYKSTNSGSFSLFQTIPSTGGVISLTDNSVNVSLNTYSYYFTTEGRCNYIFDTSQIARTILLNVQMSSPGNQSLGWSLYNDFIKKTGSQQILLSNDPSYNNSSPWNILNTEPSSTNTYSDNNTFGPNQEQLCYCIRAIENNPNPSFNRKDTSYSNIVCLTADPVVFFPNAIQLNGFNTVFFPKGTFIDYEKSSFQIYNRWGQLIFETKDILKGWNGSSDDRLVESDIYVYKAIIVGINGTVLHFDGTITVLK